MSALISRQVVIYLRYVCTSYGSVDHLCSVNVIPCKS